MQETAFDSDQHRVLVASEEAGENLVAKYCADNGVSEAVALCHLEWMQENMHLLHGAASAPAEDAGSNSQRAALNAVVMEKLFKFLVDSDNSWLAIRVAGLALSVFYPVLNDVLNHIKPVDLAKLSGSSKYNPIKKLNEFQEYLNLPKLPGQKNAEACEKMREKRLAQLDR